MLTTFKDEEPSPTLAKFLWDLGLIINPELRILICHLCERGINPSPKPVMDHLNNYHTEKGHTMRKERPNLTKELNNRLKAYPFAKSDKVRSQPPNRTPIPFIAVNRGFWCPYKGENGERCKVTHLERSSISQHMRKDHGSQRGADPTPCDCQTIFIGAERQFFPTISPQPRGSISEYKLFMDEQTSTAGTPSSKSVEPLREGELPSLVREAQWHTFVGKFRGSPKDVVGVIGRPASPSGLGDVEDILSRLPSVSSAWMTRVHRYWRETCDKMRRVLDGYPM